jgi:hypothetical protein
MRRISIGLLFAMAAAVLAAMAPAAGAAIPAGAPGRQTLEPSALAAAPSKLVPLPPQRVLDSRIGLGAAGVLPPGGTVTLAMPGRSGVPASGATAVLLNVTVAEAIGPGFVQVLPTGQADVGASSNLNVEQAGATVANLVVAPLGDAGQISIYTQGGGHLLADVFGYFATSAATVDGRYVPVSPNRLLDTRTQAPGKLNVGGSVRVPVIGRAGVPALGASAVVVNVTATDATDAGYLQVLPTGQAAFGAFSNLNVTRGQTRPNLAVVPLGADGSITVFSERGAHVLVDVFGYFTNQVAELSSDGLFVPISPTRLLDTRAAARPAAGSITPLAPIGRGGIPSSGVSAIFGNLTATDATGAGYVQLAPGPAASAPIGSWSNANVERPGQTVPNAAIANLGGDATVLLYTSIATHLIVDAAGYFTGATGTGSSSPPVVVPIRVGVIAGQSVDIDVLGYAYDPGGGALTVTGFTQPGDGNVSQLNAGTIRYSSYAGGDRTATFTVTVTNGKGQSATTPVTVTITNGTPPAPCSADYGGNGAYPAESAQLLGSGSAGLQCTNTGFRGRGYIGFWNGSQTIAFDVWVPTTGQYNVSFRYQNAREASTRELTTPGGATTVVFPNTHGGNTNADWANGSWSFTTTSVVLYAGTNTVNLGNGSGFVDLDELSSVAPVSGLLPAPPSGLSGTPLWWSNPDPDWRNAVGQFRMQWQDNANNESGYRIYGNGTTCATSGTFTLLATTGPNATSATVSERGYSVRYCPNVIKVVAFNSSGESAASNTYAVNAPTPSRPQVISYTRLDANNVRIQWTHEPTLGFRTYQFVLFSESVPTYPGPVAGSIRDLGYSVSTTAYGTTYTSSMYLAPGVDQTPYQCVSVYPPPAATWPYGIAPTLKSPVACLSSSPPPPPPGTSGTYQAESAWLSGSPAPVVSTEYPGYTGIGYVGQFGEVGQRITFTVYSASTAQAYLSLRVRTIESGVYRRIYVNGNNAGLVALPRTADAWWQNSWATAALPGPVTLYPGTNTIVIEYVGSGYSSYADIDSITLQ